MKNLFELFKFSNLYSVEYSGTFTLKFSVNNKSLLYQYITEFNIDFNSGFTNIDNDHYNILLDLIGYEINDIYLEKDNCLVIKVNNTYIKTKIETDELVDVSWEIYSKDKTYYILNDSNELFYSENLTNLNY